MLIEALVLGREKRLLHVLRNLGERHPHPPLVLLEHLRKAFPLAVEHDACPRQLHTLELGVVRQIGGATLGLQKEDPTIAELLKPLGYATGQFGKNHLGDRNEFLPTVHGLDEFYGNLYHLNAAEEPELPDYPKDP